MAVPESLQEQLIHASITRKLKCQSILDIKLAVLCRRMSGPLTIQLIGNTSYVARKSLIRHEPIRPKDTKGLFRAESQV